MGAVGLEAVWEVPVRFHALEGTFYLTVRIQLFLDP